MELTHFTCHLFSPYFIKHKFIESNMLFYSILHLIKISLPVRTKLRKKSKGFIIKVSVNDYDNYVYLLTE